MKKGALKEVFLKQFPLPRYTTPPAVGVDVSDHSIKWMMLRETARGETRIAGHGVEVVPDGVVVNGVIRQPEELSKRLSILKKKHGYTYVRASLPEEKAFLFTLPVPDELSEREIKSMIEFKLEEHVPLSSSEVVFDFTLLTPPKKEKRGEGQTRRSAAVSVFPYEDAEAYTNIFLAAGLQPLSLEIEAQAIARSVVSKNDSSTYMIVDFGRARSGLSVVNRNAVIFTTTIDIGGDVLTEAVGEMYPKADIAEIERIKREKGCLPNEANKELCTVLVSAVAALKDEINRHLVYWQTHEKKEEQEPVRKILLCGGNANLAGLTDYLVSDLSIPVEHANVWTNTTFLSGAALPPIDKYHSLGYAPTIGLALHT